MNIYEQRKLRIKANGTKPHIFKSQGKWTAQSVNFRGWAAKPITAYNDFMRMAKWAAQGYPGKPGYKPKPVNY